jgi:hypothetical protein
MFQKNEVFDSFIFPVKPNSTMKAASIHEIKKELETLDVDQLNVLCLRLAKYKKENKELLTYLLFEAHDEQDYIKEVKEETATQFEGLSKLNVYYIKKSLRRILRGLNKQIKYSSLPLTELELRIHFLKQMKDHSVPIRQNTLLMNIYQQQLKKIQLIQKKLDEDIVFDYQSNLEDLSLYARK